MSTQAKEIVKGVSADKLFFYCSEAYSDLASSCMVHLVREELRAILVLKASAIVPLLFLKI